MLKQEQEDERWLKAIGVTLAEPEAMVSGKRYAELVDRNDELTTALHNRQAEISRLRVARDEQMERAVSAEERVVWWRLFSAAVVFVAEMLFILLFVLWRCKP